MNIFSDSSLDEIYKEKRFRVAEEIERLSDDDIASANIDEIVHSIVEQHYETCPEVVKDQVYVAEPDAERYKEDVHFDLFIPFIGNGRIFGWHDRSCPLGGPRYEIKGNELTTRLSVRRHKLDELQTRINEQFAFIESFLGGLRSMIPRWNDSLKERAEEVLRSRKTEFQRQQRFKKEMGTLTIPIRKRDAKVVEQIIPVSRKIVKPAPTHSTTAKNWSIEQKTYEDVLRSMESMVRVMERTPKTFSGMGEEALRDILLVNLNGIYEGAATGETFNGIGDTDILLRIENENAFIAECLVWHGEKHLLSKMDDQLFGYATWRDSKLALIVFNKNQNFTSVIEAMKHTVSSHPQYVKQLPYDHASGARYLFRRKDDPKKEFQLTCLAFDVPK